MQATRTSNPSQIKNAAGHNAAERCGSINQPAMTRRTVLGAGLLGVASLAGLAGCTGQGGAATDAGSQGSAGDSVDAKHQVTVAMSTSNEPAAGFDPCVDWGCGEHVHEPLIQSTLVVTDKDMKFQNDLATGYEVSTDNLTWTFEIRDDVKFSDGEPLTAKDVAFTINTIRSSEQAQADLSMVTDAAATSDTVVEIHLSKPYNPLLYTLAVMGIVPEHAYGKDYGEKPIGSGRYLLKQWDRGQQAIFEANPSYYGEKPNIERFTVVFMEEDAALAAAKAGQVDVAYTSATYADQKIDGYRLEAYETVDSRGANLPVIPAGGTKEDGGSSYATGNDVTCNLEVRRAISLAVDRDAMIKNVLNGYGKAAYSIGDGMPWASPDMKIDRDLDAARKALEDAGWKRGGDKVYAKDGLRASFTVYYPTGDSVRQAMANEFANQMNELGLDVSTKGLGWDDLYQHQYSDPIMWGWGSNSPSDVYELSYSKGTMNYACYTNETTDAYLDQALAQATVDAGYPFWQKSEWDGEEGIAPQGAATWVWFANVEHLYWEREGLHVAEQKLQPHGHGWSIVNNIDRWSW